MGLAGAYGQPLEARFRTTAGAGSGLTSLNVAGRRPVGLMGARSLPRCFALRQGRRRRLTRVTSLFFGVSRRFAATRSIQRSHLLLGPARTGFRKIRRDPDAAGTGSRSLVEISRGERGRQPDWAATGAIRIRHNKLTHYHYHRIPPRSATAPSAAAATARAAASRRRRPPAAPAGRTSAGRALTARKRPSVAARRPCRRRSPPRPDPSFRR